VESFPLLGKNPPVACLMGGEEDDLTGAQSGSPREERNGVRLCFMPDKRRGLSHILRPVKKGRTANRQETGHRRGRKRHAQKKREEGKRGGRKSPKEREKKGVFFPSLVEGRGEGGRKKKPVSPKEWVSKKGFSHSCWGTSPSEEEKSQQLLPSPLGKKERGGPKLVKAEFRSKKERETGTCPLLEQRLIRNERREKEATLASIPGTNPGNLLGKKKKRFASATLGGEGGQVVRGKRGKKKKKIGVNPELPSPQGEEKSRNIFRCGEGGDCPRERGGSAAMVKGRFFLGSIRGKGGGTGKGYLTKSRTRRVRMGEKKKEGAMEPWNNAEKYPDAFLEGGKKKKKHSKHK